MGYSSIVQNAGTDTRDIPSICENAVEMSLYVAEASNKVYNDIFMAHGIKELHEVEQYGVVQEGVKELKDKIVTFFKTLWEKIKGIYAKLLVKLDESTKKKFTQAKVNLNAAKIEQIPDEAFKKMGKAYQNLDVKGKQDQIAKNAQSLLTGALTAINTAEKIEGLKEFNIVNKLSGVSADTTKEAIEKLQKEFLGEQKEVTKAWVKSAWNDLLDIGFTGKRVKRSLQDSYKSEKGIIDKAIKSASHLQNEGLASATESVIKYMKDIALAADQMIQGLNSAVKKIYGSSRKVILSTLRAAINNKVIGESSIWYEDGEPEDSMSDYEGQDTGDDTSVEEASYIDSLFSF